jgi:predicted outer membrane protein
MTRGRSSVIACVVAAAAIALPVQRASAQTGGAGAPAGNTATGGQNDSREFINKMTIAGMAEVQLGKMASEKATNPDVKAFGQMMVKDHTQANKELAQIASKMNVTPPAQLDKKHQDLAAKLSKLQGAEFDREYMSAMVDGHEEVASALRAHSGNRTRTTSRDPAGTGSGASGTAGTGAPGTNPGSPASKPGSTTGSTSATGTSGGDVGDAALTKWAAKTLPVVEQHLQKAKQLEDKVK